MSLHVDFDCNYPLEDCHCILKRIEALEDDVKRLKKWRNKK